MKKETELNELIKRVIVAFVGIPLAFLIIYFGGYYFLVTVAVIASIALWEFYKISEKKHAFPNKIPGILSGLMIIGLFYFNQIFSGFIWYIILFAFITILILTLELWRNKPNGLLNVSTTLAGLIYISVSFSCLLGIREFYRIFDIPLLINDSKYINIQESQVVLINNIYCGWLVASMFISVWLSDSAAYFIGVKWGKHKLFPRISPKKSREGSIAGFIGAIIGFSVSASLLIPKFPVEHSIIIGAIIGIVGQVGDLAESLLKRDAGIKDSSAILPGHGGVLDRFDSILFVAPAVYIYLLILLFTN
ncbi:MAG: phosphatidate cytidylyltransferase [Ignavibacteriae bacterium]|nr:phosphatidate cytidylyltransferase [Ignavibacteriota bacterium]